MEIQVRISWAVGWKLVESNYQTPQNGKLGSSSSVKAAESSLYTGFAEA